MKKCIYLNNAATSFPKPQNVIQSLNHLLSQPPKHGRGNGALKNEQFPVTQCRKELALLFNSPHPERIIFTSGATESLNLAIKGLGLEGKHVVTTNVEHNSVLRLLKTMEKRQLISLTIVNCKNSSVIDPVEIVNALTHQTAAVIINHCSNVTGVVNDLQTLGSLLKERGVVFMVDAAQSAGLYTVNVQSMHIDLLIFTGHKGLYGIQGIGGIYISEGLSLEPLKIGGTGSKSDFLFQPPNLPAYYEAGTQNIPGIVSLLAGLEFIRGTGLSVICRKIQNDVTILRQFLSKSANVIFYPKILPQDQFPTILSFMIKGIEVSDIAFLLNENFNITVRTGLHCAPLIHKKIGSFPHGTVRVSPSYFTTKEELKEFMSAMDEILLMIN